MKSIDWLVEELKIKLSCNNEETSDSLFEIAEDNDLEVISNLFKTYSFYNSIYEKEELEELKDITVPKKIIYFYKRFSPINGIDLGGDVFLLSLDDIKHENSELAPGALLIKYGVITFATTTGGNAICMDLNVLNDGEPRIIIVDKSVFNGKIITLLSKGVMKQYDLSYELIDKYAVEINKKFTVFIKMLIDNQIDDVEEYLD
ncbi:SMI1 / KNR4 family (SUKH-1) [Clostridium cavendishii DSM 21758]|uniref:SMI1 / KNR4 family (SUKH-1) n=1 Tax=Clostridium cavendishii DSM 21758 TaxID=1121302 RepID=A0A1M6MHI6_9CLOT|nr:SMI1/KNR4 family protein [Clostridium cavendishii]SHJ82917.1 SMI1 / KNR4 family (SUKH-1) [Clostridium cavendishii DSM 21758]